MNVYPFFEKWLLDLNAEQFPDGMVGNSIPATTSLHFGTEVRRLIKEENENRLDEPEYHTWVNGVRDADYKEDEEFYREYAKEIKRVYNQYLIQKDGTIQEGHQASYVRCLQFGICSEENEKLAAKKLVESVRGNGMKLNTGFLSTPFLLFQLLKHGYQEEAFAVLEQTEAPGWLHPILMGATTILEDWTGFENHINSFNHYSYGAVCDFLFGAVCGIEPMPEKPGYKEFTIRPVPGGHLTHAEAVYESQYGTIRSAWEKKDEKTRFTFEIPVNTTAHITLPDGYQETVGSGSYTYEI